MSEKSDVIETVSDLGPDAAMMGRNGSIPIRKLYVHFYEAEGRVTMCAYSRERGVLLNGGFFDVSSGAFAEVCNRFLEQYRTATGNEDFVNLRVPREAWDLLREMLDMDAHSSGVTRELRDHIAAALATVEEITPEHKRPANCECDNTHEQNGTCCRPCWAEGFRTVQGGHA